MTNHLADAVSPYLRSHADNPVDWFAWGPDAFAEAARRDVPVLISIGYSTCHWCHVMARESFSDPVLASYLNDNFVSIKVDREEHPDVDSSYLAAAGLFTPNLGWPLNVFATPNGHAFYAGTYWPPEPMGQHPSFRQILESVQDAWRERRNEVESNASTVSVALAAQGQRPATDLPTDDQFTSITASLIGFEDRQYGGFGSAPKFPMVPVLLMLLDRGSLGDEAALALADRALTAMANSALRDPVEGGFFRYATRQDWTEPHYERMLYDNAQLLRAYTTLGVLLPERSEFTNRIVDGISSFLLEVLRVPGGGFASAQDSESTVDGVRVEGGYYALAAAERARQQPPAIDEKVLTGWNGLAIDALAYAGFARNNPKYLQAACGAADYLISRHLQPTGALLRASINDRTSGAKATLEDYGLLAAGLVQLALATGETSYATTARELVDRSLDAGRAATSKDSEAAAAVLPFAVPGGADPVLVAHGTALAADPSEGAYPSGSSAMALAAHRLYLLTGERRYLDAAIEAMMTVSALVAQHPTSFGAAVSVMSGLGTAVSQLVIVTDDPESAGGELPSVARNWYRAGSVVSVLTEGQAEQFAGRGFELFEGRVGRLSQPTAYLCHDFACLLPVTEPDQLASDLASVG